MRRDAQVWVIRYFFLFSLITTSITSFAVDWSVSGFGTLGYSYENEDDLAYLRDITRTADISDNGSFGTDSNLGIQLDGTFNRKWSFTTQLVLDDSVKHNLDTVTELAFLRFTPNANWEFRAGRAGVNAYAAANSRNIDYAHLWVRPPQELYGSVVFNSLDGVGATYYSNNPEFNWQAKIQFGRNSEEGELSLTKDRFSTDIEQVLGLSFDVIQDNWKWQLSYAHVGSLTVNQSESIKTLQQGIGQVAMLGIPGVSDEAAAISEHLVIDGEKLDYFQAAVGYFDGVWTAQVELFQVNAKKKSIPQGYGGYGLIGRNFGQFTPYLMYGVFNASNEVYTAQTDWGAVDPNLGVLQASSIAGINAVRVDQATYSFGLRWDVTSNIALKAQIDHVEISPFGYGLWAASVDRFASGSDIQVYTLNLNFIF
ncbi:hypothetical protein [Vibrio mexicanus]|uniref:hypothetical protein n=1 Tax=Vibrio mexicanus TaxID=1004326 RepID=UPI00063C40DE|nr:hypothetical protein [Vibrio mexicanus]